MIDMANMINEMMPLIIVVAIFAYGFKVFQQWMERRKRQKPVDKPRSHGERVYVGFKNVAKASNLLKKTEVFMKGDSLVPSHKVGETITGVIPMSDEYVVFIRSKWWKFWEDPMCLRMAPELTSDLNGGQLHIRGRGLEPLGERYAYVIPPAKFYEEMSIEDIEKRRSRIAHKKSVQLLNFDLNNDTATNVKSALRGREELAEKELYETGDIPRVTREQLKRENERKREELEEGSQGSQMQQMMNGGGGGQG